MSVAAVILAAGQGTRMKSSLPKMLHPIAGKPMIQYSLDAVRALGCDQVALVIGYGAEQVRQAVGNQAAFVEQHEPRGTGHAVLQARDSLRGKADNVLVLYGDMPLLRSDTIKRLVELEAKTRATIAMLTVHSSDSMGFGRILRDKLGRVQGIVEESDATPEQRAIQELNCGVYCFQDKWLWEHLSLLQPNGKKREYYLTDLIAMAVGEERAIEAIQLQDVTEVIGINTRVHLAKAQAIMRDRINIALMEAGVTIDDPATTYIETDVTISADTVVEPNTHVKGKTRIGAHCRIGANSIILDSQVGDNCEIVASAVEGSVLEYNVHVGPFAHLRGGTYLEHDVYVGNHAEIKNSQLGQAVHVGHFSYIGDAQVGARTNIGAGTITCNYDGRKKHRTVIGEDSFIGSDTLLRAPVTVGARATTGAGSVVTKDIPSDSTAVGSPARVIKKSE
jgi:bifunctional UDP-N-acetylglucosamine pyrophosphorylase/glucosamine-1-phosphate N-acetyltransferase